MTSDHASCLTALVFGAAISAHIKRERNPSTSENHLLGAGLTPAEHLHPDRPNKGNSVRPGEQFEAAHVARLTDPDGRGGQCAGLGTLSPRFSTLRTPACSVLLSRSNTESLQHPGQRRSARRGKSRGIDMGADALLA